jgi:hypothetical protein
MSMLLQLQFATTLDLAVVHVGDTAPDHRIEAGQSEPCCCLVKTMKPLGRILGEMSFFRREEDGDEN